MDILQLISELKLQAQSARNSALQQRLAEVEEKALALLREKTEAVEQRQRIESQLASKLSQVRHDLAQPLTTLQAFLELLPEVLEREKAAPGVVARPEFWNHHYRRAQDALKAIPQLLKQVEPKEPS
jgi:signal transduction histidine kinase